MARLKPLSLDEAPEAVRPVMADVVREIGMLPTSLGIQARCPEILQASRALGLAPGRSNTLPTELRALVCIRIAQIVACPS